MSCARCVFLQSANAMRESPSRLLDITSTCQAIITMSRLNMEDAENAPDAAVPEGDADVALAEIFEKCVAAACAFGKSAAQYCNTSRALVADVEYAFVCRCG